MTARSILRAVPLALLVLAGRDAVAQPLPPACGPAGRGTVACMDGDSCTCDWFRGGSITAEPSGWRWDCRIEQMCGAVAPADDGATALPPGTVLAPQIGAAPGVSSGASAAGMPFRR